MRVSFKYFLQHAPHDTMTFLQGPLVKQRPDHYCQLECRIATFCRRLIAARMGIYWGRSFQEQTVFAGNALLRKSWYASGICSG